MTKKGKPQPKMADVIAANVEPATGARTYTQAEVEEFAKHFHERRLVPKDALAVAIFPTGGGQYQWAACFPLGESKILPSHVQQVMLNVASSQIWRTAMTEMGDDGPQLGHSYGEATEEDDGSITFG